MKTKISFLLALLFTFLSVQIAASQTFNEEFDYNAGDPITNHGWVPFSGIGINPILTCSTGLEFPCYACVIGNAACLTSTGEDVYKFLNRKITSGSYYTTFMVNVTSAQSGDFFLHLGDSVVNNSNKIARVYAKSSGGMVSFGLAKNNETPVYTPAVYSTGTTYLIILKYTFISGSDNDLVSLMVFDDLDCLPSEEPNPPSVGPLGTGEDDLPNIGKIVLQQGANAQAPVLKIDGICSFDFWDNGALPVELSSFNATVHNNDVTLKWSTASEINNSGFNIERKLASENDWKVAGNVAGNGTTNTTQNYNFLDRNISSGRYDYRLKQMDFNGNFQYFNLSSDVEIGTPVKFNLSQNYPNPFNPSTKVNFDLAKEGFVSIKVFDNSGKEVATLVNEFKTAGYYTVNFNAGNISSGIYYYRMQTEGFTKVMKMSFIK